MLRAASLFYRHFLSASLFLVLVAVAPCQLSFAIAVSDISLGMYDSQTRESDRSKYYSVPYGSQQGYYLDPHGQHSSYYRQGTGNQQGYYTLPRGQSTYFQGQYESGRFYISPSAPYPGQKQQEIYGPTSEQSEGGNSSPF